MHAARILLHASLAELEAFKLEGRLVVPATFGGPMQSKFRLFVGSVLLLALPAFGQASEPTPAATTAAPAIVVEGVGTFKGLEGLPPFKLFQHGDGIYALRLRRKLDPNPDWKTVGFVRVENKCSFEFNGSAEGQMKCDQSEWVLSVDKMKAFGDEAKLPLPKDYDSELIVTQVPISPDLPTAAVNFSKEGEGREVANDSFAVFRVISIRQETKFCGATIRELKDCPTAPPVNGSGSPAPK